MEVAVAVEAAAVVAAAADAAAPMTAAADAAEAAAADITERNDPPKQSKALLRGNLCA